MKTYKNLKPMYEDFAKAYNKALLAKTNIYKLRKGKRWNNVDIQFKKRMV